MTLRIAIPDMVSPSYFPALAAVELGHFGKEGLEATIELLFPVTKTYEALRDGELDFVGGAAHAPLYAFRDWAGCKLLCALSQSMYWFLVVRKDLGLSRGDLRALKGLRIGAAPGPADGLKRLLVESGIDPEREVNIAAVPATAGVSFGLAAASALEKGAVDGFWANGMAAEIALRGGFGTLVIDARRGDGPKDARHYTFPALVATQKTIDERPDTVATAIRAVVRAQRALKNDPSLAAAAAKRHFPAAELALIPELVGRDAPYYDPTISGETVDSLNAFARATGLLSGAPGYERVVATQFQSLWGGAS
ncbi:MAG: ABC transporter substrate-binding protein [Betaproteobacteria bacterium]|nr:MAG: ABC transporter substrate-binding protein [Betaproteobacteria bacterium]